MFVIERVPDRLPVTLGVFVLDDVSVAAVVPLCETVTVAVRV